MTHLSSGNASLIISPAKVTSAFAAVLLMMATVVTPHLMAGLCGAAGCTKSQPNRVVVCEADAESTCCSSRGGEQDKAPAPFDPAGCECCHEVPAVDTRVVVIPRDHDAERLSATDFPTVGEIVVWSHVDSVLRVSHKMDPLAEHSDQTDLHLRLCVLIC